MAFTGVRQWARGTLTKIAASSTVLGQGELLVDETGGVYGGDGATQIKNLSRLVRQSEHGAQIGASTVNPDHSISVHVATPWGIDGSGNPYYNAAGVTGSEAAVLVMNPITGQPTLVKPGTPAYTNVDPAGAASAAQAAAIAAAASDATTKVSAEQARAIAAEAAAVNQKYRPPPNAKPGNVLLPWTSVAQTNVNLVGGTGGLGFGRFTCMPIDVGPNALSVSALVASCGIAQAGGTVVSKLGVYADDGTGMMPDFTQLLKSGVITYAGTGFRSVATAGWTPPATRYWAGVFYMETVAPTTRAAIQSCTQSIQTVPGASFTLNHGWTVDGCTDLPINNTAIPAVPYSSSTPLVGFQAA